MEARSIVHLWYICELIRGRGGQSVGCNGDMGPVNHDNNNDSPQNLGPVEI
jgi:hypothetical protein